MTDNARGYVPVSYLMEVSKEEVEAEAKEQETGPDKSNIATDTERTRARTLSSDAPPHKSSSSGAQQQQQQQSLNSKALTTHQHKRSAEASASLSPREGYTAKSTSFGTGSAFSRIRTAGSASKVSNLHTRHELQSYDRAEQLFEQIMKQRATLFRKIEDNLSQSMREIAVFQEKNEHLIDRIRQLDEAIEHEKRQILENA